LYETWVEHFDLCPVLTVPSDDLDYVAKPQHLALVASKVQEFFDGQARSPF
jgi:deoxyadenosine/deoxycytidine kinase